MISVYTTGFNIKEYCSPPPLPTQTVHSLFVVHPTLTIGKIGPDQSACDIYCLQLVSGCLCLLVRMSKLFKKLRLLDEYRPYLF